MFNLENLHDAEEYSCCSRNSKHHATSSEETEEIFYFKFTHSRSQINR